MTLAILLLLAAYVPFGPIVAYASVLMAWSEISIAKPFESIVWVLLICGTILGNIQVVFCSISASRYHLYFQNPAIKFAATIGQLSWMLFGYEFYAWYCWVIGSAILFSITPDPIFCLSRAINTSDKNGNILNRLNMLESKDEA